MANTKLFFKYTSTVLLAAVIFSLSRCTPETEIKDKAFKISISLKSSLSNKKIADGTALLLVEKGKTDSLKTYTENGLANFSFKAPENSKLDMVLNICESMGHTGYVHNFTTEGDKSFTFELEAKSFSVPLSINTTKEEIPIGNIEYIITPGNITGTTDNDGKKLIPFILDTDDYNEALDTKVNFDFLASTTTKQIAYERTLFAERENNFIFDLTKQTYQHEFNISISGNIKTPLLTNATATISYNDKTENFNPSTGIINFVSDNETENGILVQLSNVPGYENGEITVDNVGIRTKNGETHNLILQGIIYNARQTILVTDGTNPISGANINYTFGEETGTVQSGTDGKASLEFDNLETDINNLPLDEYTLATSTTKTGYPESANIFNIYAGENDPITISMGANKYWMTGNITPEGTEIKGWKNGNIVFNLSGGTYATDTIQSATEAYTLDSLIFTKEGYITEKIFNFSLNKNAVTIQNTNLEEEAPTEYANNMNFISNLTIGKAWAVTSGQTDTIFAAINTDGITNITYTHLDNPKTIDIGVQGTGKIPQQRERILVDNNEYNEIFALEDIMQTNTVSYTTNVISGTAWLVKQGQTDTSFVAINNDGTASIDYEHIMNEASNDLVIGVRSVGKVPSSKNLTVVGENNYNEIFTLENDITTQTNTVNYTTNVTTGTAWLVEQGQTDTSFVALNNGSGSIDYKHPSNDPTNDLIIGVKSQGKIPQQKNLTVVGENNYNETFTLENDITTQTNTVNYTTNVTTGTAWLVEQGQTDTSFVALNNGSGSIDYNHLISEASNDLIIGVRSTGKIPQSRNITVEGENSYTENFVLADAITTQTNTVNYTTNLTTGTAWLVAQGQTDTSFAAINTNGTASIDYDHQSDNPSNDLVIGVRSTGKIPQSRNITVEGENSYTENFVLDDAITTQTNTVNYTTNLISGTAGLVKQGQTDTIFAAIIGDGTAQIDYEHIMNEPTNNLILTVKSNGKIPQNRTIVATGDNNYTENFVLEDIITNYTTSISGKALNLTKERIRNKTNALVIENASGTKKYFSLDANGEFSGDIITNDPNEQVKIYWEMTGYDKNTIAINKDNETYPIDRVIAGDYKPYDENTLVTVDVSKLDDDYLRAYAGTNEIVDNDTLQIAIKGGPANTGTYNYGRRTPLRPFVYTELPDGTTINDSDKATMEDVVDQARNIFYDVETGWAIPVENRTTGTDFGERSGLWLMRQIPLGGYWNGGYGIPGETNLIEGGEARVGRPVNSGKAYLEIIGPWIRDGQAGNAYSVSISDGIFTLTPLGKAHMSITTDFPAGSGKE